MSQKYLKIVVFVPEKAADKVRQAMGDAGAGQIGNYSHCTFSQKGIDRFIPNYKANPTDGKAGEMSEVTQERIETICIPDKLEQVVNAIKKAHPYEEAPIDVYQVETL